MSRVLAGGALLALVAGTLFTFGLGAYALLDPDEGRHAEVAREMAAATGLRRLFLPTLDFQPYHEKPAGYYWLAAASYALGGVSEASARAPSALAALLAVLAVYAWAVPRVGIAGALGAGFVLSTSVGWFVAARLATLDMTLTATITMGVLAGLDWLERPSPRRPLLVPYLLAALGTLVKGPIALALVGGPLALAVLVRPSRPTLREFGLIRGGLVVTAVIAALYLPVAVLDLDYVRHFVWTHVRRFGDQAPHAAPVWYYAVVLPILVLPWTFFAVAPLRRAARDPERRALLLWAVFVVVCMTFARGKLPTYVLSVLPPIALIVGPELAGAACTEKSGTLRSAGWLTLVVLAAGGSAVLLLPVFAAVPFGGTTLALATVAIVLLGAAAGLAASLWRRCEAIIPLVVLGAMLAVYPLVVRFVMPAVAAVYSDREVARFIAGAGPSTVIAFKGQSSSLAFYLRGPVIETYDSRVVAELFARDEVVFLVTGRRHFAEIERLLGNQARRWHSSARRALYANRPPEPGQSPSEAAPVGG